MDNNHETIQHCFSSTTPKCFVCRDNGQVKSITGLNHACCFRILWLVIFAGTEFYRKHRISTGHDEIMNDDKGKVKKTGWQLEEKVELVV